ncbi:pyrroline-5-carboxylate reductase [Wigglesworthia glossinidia endosymbiont of Glossina morsitans morsitans (Yale colony)]|uniref:Pyrroline-5-carboxylate reductase n=1 Tax=Wigglesworthia glossinidia endosymbiont of Glossina morsitans morsitans (Yale colony) TaxID=1142511 RepID=H6Q5N9_WIGGL|nr:pyrroline-5-carboxylate reductase [Wigglesworthia glossinidia]AFA40943.1 pyrroline-5-carboxylate reductase [Wigglesworthia glossinidia endosymbiont of Glossina morsitans morsitans (Yale colony)]
MKKLTFIGSGKIAESMILGLISSKYLKENICICSPDEQSRTAISNQCSLKNFKNNTHGMHIGDIIILAVKPNVIPIVCSEIKDIENLSKKIIISVAAGVTVKKIHEYISNKNATIVRAMPNTPVLINQGVTGLYAQKINKNQKEMITELFSKISKTFWLSHENELNYIIAAASSAPAYFFLMMECMQKSAQKMGLNVEYIKELIVQTAKGSAMLAEYFHDKSFQVLKHHVVSKGGTTEAALNVFEQYNFQKIIEKSMRSAADKAKEIENAAN